ERVRADPLGPVQPAEALRDAVLEPLGLSPYTLAAYLHVPRTRIERLVREETSFTPDTALRLARYLGTTAEFWLRLQVRYDLETARRKLDKDIGTIKPRKTA